VKTAANNLINACNNCHIDYRDVVGVGGPRRPRAGVSVETDVTALVKDLVAKKDISQKAAALAKIHHLEHVMEAFKEPEEGGIEAAKGGSIEARIAGLAKRPLKAASLKEDRAELIQVARISAVIAEVVGHQRPARPPSAWRAREWKRYTEDMKKAGLALEGALDKNDTKKVKAAALRLNNACNNCHTDFRDN
jgi:cytochrome c556